MLRRDLATDVSPRCGYRMIWMVIFFYTMEQLQKVSIAFLKNDPYICKNDATISPHSGATSVAK